MINTKCTTALFFIIAGLALIAIGAAGPVMAQSGHRCCVPENELPPADPNGAQCFGTVPNCRGFNCTGQKTSTAVNASCSGNSTTLNCTNASLGNNGNIVTHTYTFSCGAGQNNGDPCQCEATTANPVNNVVNNCLDNECP